MSPETIGRYQIQEELGHSQMTSVYRAFDTQANREVVVKLFSLGQDLNAEAKLSLKAHFRRELKIIASLEHPSIVPVYDVGEHDGQPYYVMRYMAGGSLLKRIANGKMSIEETAHIIDRLAPALEHAHKQNIIHRDIKPDNILFDLDGHPYVSDFGVAKPAEANEAATTEGPVGTPEYMSPEQANQEPVDERSDVYSLGIVIRQMLTGKKPAQFTGDILNEAPELPEEMNEIMKISLAHDKRDRYVTVGHLARAFHRAAFGEDSSTTSFDRYGERAAMRSSIVWVIGSVALLIAFLWLFAQNGATPFLAPAPTATAVILQPTSLVSGSDTAIGTASPGEPAVEATPTNPPPPGNADQIALVSGNNIFLMNMDGSGLIQVRTENSPKSHLQWIPGNRLIYISRNCAYMLDAQTRQDQQLSCFAGDENLDGFYVSHDAKYVAISVQSTLNVLDFDVEFLQTVKSRFELFNYSKNCFYTQFAFQDVIWGEGNSQLLAHVVSPRFVNSDQLFLLNLDIENCFNVELTRIDIIPGTRLDFSSESSKKISSFDWNGKSLMLFTDTIRNDGFGDLYLYQYDGTSQQFTKVNPINGECCYRDPRWSPDGKYIMFAFQHSDRSDISLYYIPFEDIENGGEYSPIAIPSGFFATSREKPQPALRPTD